MVSKTKLTNEFPKDWEIRKLYEIGSTYGGLTNKNKEDFENGNSKFITYKNIYNNTFVNINELESVRINPGEKQNKVKYGDVFFTASSETPDEVGISSVLLEDIENVYLNSFCFGFRFNDINLTIPEFYGYYFRGPIFRREIYPLAQGSTRFNLSRSEFVKLKIPIPPVPEQRKIAAILSSVDEAIEKTKAIIEQTEKVKKGLMQQLLTKGIGHTKFKKTEIGEIPEGWELKRVGDLVKFEGGSQPPRSTFIFEPKEGYIRLLQIRDYKTDKYATYIPIELAKRFCNEDDVMIGRYGPPIFQIFRGLKGAYNVALIKAIPNENYVTKDYLYYFLKQEPLFKLIDSLSQRTSGQTGIDMDALKNYGFPLPPISEQKKITAILDNVQAKLDKENDYLQQLQIIKKSLMQVLLTGKVRVKVDDEVVSS